MTEKSKSKPVFDMDALEYKGKPFPVKLGGEVYNLLDIQEMDYRDVIAAQDHYEQGSVEEALELVVPLEDREAFFGNRLPIWKMEQLFKAYSDHFGIPELGESDASSAS